MRLFHHLSILIANVAADDGNETKKITDIREIKKEKYLNDLAIDTTEQLRKHMQVEGFDISKYMRDAIAIYRADFPQKDVRMGKLAQNAYKLDPSGGLARTSQDMMAGMSFADKVHIMKYLQLKFTTLFLQQNKFLGKYCFYGCWCFPRAAGAEYSGFGVPVDNIDKSCREYTTCYNCIYNQKLLGQRCNEHSMDKYNIGGSQDPATGKVSLFCKDPQGTCLRSRCECDLDLALKLQAHETEWNPNYHHMWGNPPFNPKETCGFNVNQFLVKDPEQQQTLTANVLEHINPDLIQQIAAQEAQKEAIKLAKEQVQAAQGGSARPNISQISNSSKSPNLEPRGIFGPIIGCCGRAPHVHFFRQGQRCCQDGSIVHQDSPCPMDFS